MFAPASTNANVVKNSHSGKLNSCAAVVLALCWCYCRFAPECEVIRVIVIKIR